MKFFIKKIAPVVAITVAVVLSGVGLVGTPAYAADAYPCDKDNSPACKVCIASNQVGTGMTDAEAKAACSSGSDTTVDNVWKMAREVINWILIAAGIISIGFIVYAGIRYVLSGGDAEKVKKAKNTLLYAIIGLLIAALALVIVNLILTVGTTATTTQ